MDRHIITKIIEQDNTSCPTFKYGNPLLDKNIADLLAKGFIKLLNRQESNDINNREKILKNIRKSCKIEPSNHLHVDDNVTEVIRNAYERCPNTYNIEKDLDAFLIKNLKEINIGPHYPPSYKPDVIKALLNLNEDKQKIHEILLKDVIYWDVYKKDNCCTDILTTMWNFESLDELTKAHYDIISIKVKPLIEKILLSRMLEMLNTIIIEEDTWFSENTDLERLVKICSVSGECFQICCSIMNTIFINTQFDMQVGRFITLFINAVKCEVECISKLYSCRLQHIVLLLDIHIEKLPGDLLEKYVEQTLTHLSLLRKESRSDLIMLLSHFTQWFNKYYESYFCEKFSVPYYLSPI